MDVFARLGAAVERSWLRAGHRLARLPALAAAELGAFDARGLDPIALAERYARTARPPQLPVPFGDAQVTVWRGQHVLVQLIYWLDHTTPIHQHGFAGAFRVLTGASLHTTYEFEPETTGTAFRVGVLARRSQDILEPGDVREIGPGGALIHNLNHLVFPSVTLTIRTPFLRALSPQWVYHPPGVAVDPQAFDATLRARTRLFEACLQLDRRRAVRAATSIIDDGLAASWSVLETAATRAAERELVAVINIVRRRHRAHGRVLADAIDKLRARSRLVALRRTVRSRPHRTFLALLADGADAPTIIDAIRRLYPGRPPTERIETWLVELAEPLGLSLDRDAARVLRRLIEGVTPAAIAAEIGSYTSREVATLAGVVARSPLFAPLVTASAGAAPRTSRST
jgi:hypothetical protein